MVLIQRLLLYNVNHVVVMLTCIFQANFLLEKGGGLYQKQGQPQPPFTQRLGHQAHNRKTAYWSKATS